MRSYADIQDAVYQCKPATTRCVATTPISGPCLVAVSRSSVRSVDYRRGCTDNTRGERGVEAIQRVVAGSARQGVLLK